VVDVREDHRPFLSTLKVDMEPDAADKNRASVTVEPRVDDPLSIERGKDSAD
jgi:hypothetical protein